MREPDGVDNDGVDGDDNAEEADCDVVTPQSGEITVETRQLTITLTGNLVRDTSVVHSVTRDVRVRNDLVRVR